MFAVGVRTAFIESPGFLRRTRRSVREETLPGELFRFFTPRFGPPGSLSIASRFFDNIRTRCRVPSSQLRATPASRPPGNSRKVISTGSGVTRFETTRWNAICDEELFDVAMKISIGSLRGFFRRGAARFCLATFFEGSLLSRIDLPLPPLFRRWRVRPEYRKQQRRKESDAPTWSRGTEKSKYRTGKIYSVAGMLLKNCLFAEISSVLFEIHLTENS